MRSDKHCASCGKRGISWPEDDPSCCSERCAAESFVFHLDSAPLGQGFCGGCGGRRRMNDSGCSYDCPEANEVRP